MASDSVAVAVVGAGLLGRGIAACVAAGGPHEVRLYTQKPENLPTAMEKVHELVKFMSDNGVASPSQGRVVPCTTLKEAVTGAKFVFEAVYEDMALKQNLFAEMASLTGPSTILCTNTSSLSVSKIAEQMPGSSAERMMAAHFIGPAHLVPLVELCPGKKTAGGQAGPVETVRAFLDSVGKKPIVLKKEIDGFIAARLQAAIYRECLHLKLSGVADPEAIDSAVFNGFGRRYNQLGPFLQADFAGVDLTQNTHANFFPQLGAYQRDVRADELVPQGRLGAKVLKGHYDWTEAMVKEVSGRRDAELLRRLKVDRQLSKL